MKTNEKLFNIFEGPEVNQSSFWSIATIKTDTALNAQKIYYNNCLPTKKCREFEYSAVEVKSGDKYVGYDKRSKKIVIKTKL